MAAPVPKHKTRGHQKKMKNRKVKMKEASGDISSEDLMTLEDEQLLKGVNDEDNGESVVDVDASGNDVPQSEILGFLQKIGVDKSGFQSNSLPKTEKVKRKDAKAQKGKKPVNVKTQPAETSVPKGPKGQAKTGKLKGKKAMSVTEKLPQPEKLSQSHHSVNKTGGGESQATVKFLQIYNTRKHLVLKPGEMWREEEARPLGPDTLNAKLVKEAEKLAERLFQDEVALYSKQKENTKRSEARWLKTVLSSGTLSDKMAALMLQIQESPLHNLSSLESLISMAGKKGRRESMMAVDTVRDLFLTGLLPDNRKLRSFNQQPVNDLSDMTSKNIESRDKFLVMWYFESLLKTKYAEFIKTLGEMSFDTLQATKEKAISTIHRLLTSKPEQENVLLPMLVNKLGDPTVKSKATYLLTKLVDDHPNMMSVIVREIQHLLFRPNVSQRAQYYAICFLAQLRLSQDEEDLAAKLIEIYFHFFQAFLKKGDVDNKMMSALLTGVNRAYVYTKAKKPELSEQLNSIYKIIPSVNFHTGVQALQLLYQVTDASTNASDRYYMSLYRKLADPALKSSSKQAIFMNLLFKSLKSDVVDRRTKAFIKRILQVYSQQPPQIICAILVLLSQVLKERPGLMEVKYTSEHGVWSDDEEEKFVDLPAPDEFDSSLVNGDGPHPPSDDDENSLDHKVNGGVEKKGSTKSSWIHRVNFGGSGGKSEYDPYNRNPLHCHAELECVWELQQLARHYHPSVSLYASCILKGQPVDYDGDPLRDYTLIRFLDRFVYKNPKKNMEQNLQMFKHFKKLGPSGMRAVPVNSKEFLEAAEEGIPEDEKFFHRYFVERAKRKQEDGSDADSDDGSVADEEFDSYLDAFEKDADLEDIGDIDLDFARDKKKTTTTTKGKQESSEEEESDDDDDEDLDLGDEALAAEFQEEIEGLEDGDSDMDDDVNDEGGLEGQSFNEEDVEFSTDEDDELKGMMIASVGKKGKKRPSQGTDFLDMGPGNAKKKKKKDPTDLFASAEEFAHLLEEDTETGLVSLGGTGDLRNKDKSAKKQLDWEEDRDKWLKGNRRGSKGHKKKFQGNMAGGMGKGHKKKPQHNRPAGKSFGKNKKPNQKQFKDRRKR